MNRAQKVSYEIAEESKENDAGFLLRESLREAQEQAVVNGTSEMTLDEINAIIAEVRREMYAIE